MGTAGHYRRVLVKISGESLCAAGGSGIDAGAIRATVTELAAARQTGAQIAVVVGAGNFLRGRDLQSADFIPRVTADGMGMLATVINGLALGEALKAAGIDARVHSAFPAGGFCEPFVRGRADRQLNEGRVVVLAGGTGQPFFTTDTCAALRAAQLDADAMMKATKVDGVFDADPATCPDATKFDRLTYAEVLARRLGVMDLAAVSLCMESKIPVIVFRLADPGRLAAAVGGEAVGTTIAAD